MTKHTKLVLIPIIIFAMIGLLVFMASQYQDMFNLSKNRLDPSTEKQLGGPVQYLSFDRWSVRLPLSKTTQDLTASLNSHIVGDIDRMSSYTISIKGGSGCLATPDNVATILRVRSNDVITKPTSPLANQYKYEGYYGQTWQQYYETKLAENKDKKGIVKDVKLIGEYTYVLMYLPSKCGAPDSKSSEQEINRLRDYKAEELRKIFQKLEKVDASRI